MRKTIATMVMAIVMAAKAEVIITYDAYAYNGVSGVRVTSVTGDDKLIEVPSEHDGKPVIAIGAGAFMNNTSVQRIVLPETVKTIQYALSTSGDLGAFRGCIALTTCNIPSGVTDIPGYCFMNCGRLRKVELPSGLKGIGNAAFYGCSSLTTVVFPDGLMSVGSGAFHGCTSLKEAILPDSVISFGAAFYGCRNLERVHLPSGISWIGDECFIYCLSLREVNIPNGVTSIGVRAFSNCSALSVITVPSSVANLGQGAFQGVGSVVFLGKPPAGLPGAGVSTAVYPKEYGELWQAQISIAKTGGFVKENAPSVKVVTAAVRENDPTIMDVVYRVTSTKQTVKVRAVAFEDGVRSFSNVVRVETLVDGTGVNVGDNVAANVEHTISWNVAADLKTDLANIVVEVLAIDDDILPLELTTIPANGTSKAMELSWNLLTERQIFDALLWLYADKDAGLTLADGVLKNGSKTLAEGESLYRRYQSGKYFYDALEYIFSKMGYSTLEGDTLTYANSMTRLGLTLGTGSSDALRQYAYRWIEAE